jgi:putative colanic acid biosynthesis glycosyltransferase
MLNKPKISIIIATKNAEQNILECLKSIQNQTYDNIEIIIADALSVDNTLNTIKSNNYLISHYFSEEDSGIYDALNKAINFATGEWFLFLGSDDRLFSKNALEDVFNSLFILSKNNNFDLIICDGFSNNNLIKNCFNWKIYKGNSLNHQCVIYSRKIFDRYCYDVSYKYGADYKLNLTLYLQKIKFIKLKVNLSVYSSFGLTSIHTSECYSEERRVRTELLPLSISRLLNLLLDLKYLIKSFIKF